MPTPEAVLRMFRAGADTIAIARHFFVSEAHIYNLLHRARERERQARAA